MDLQLDISIRNITVRSDLYYISAFPYIVAMSSRLREGEKCVRAPRKALPPTFPYKARSKACGCMSDGDLFQM